MIMEYKGRTVLGVSGTLEGIHRIMRSFWHDENDRVLCNERKSGKRKQITTWDIEYPPDGINAKNHPNRITNGFVVELQGDRYRLLQVETDPLQTITYVPKNADVPEVTNVYNRGILIGNTDIIYHGGEKENGIKYYAFYYNENCRSRRITDYSFDELIARMKLLSIAQ